MTLQRDPGGVGNAVTKIAAELGWGPAAEIAETTEGTLRNWSNDRTRQTPPLRAAMRLDTAYVAKTGREPPIFTAYAMALEVAARPAAGIDAIMEITQACAKEGGEGVAALMGVIKDPSDPRRRRAARRECLEAAEKLTAAANLMDDGAEA